MSKEKLKVYTIRLKQTKKGVVHVFGYDKDEARYMAELAANHHFGGREMKWNKIYYDYNFLDETESLYPGYRQAACSEWIREKKRKGYSYKAVLRGVLDNYDYDYDLAKNMVSHVWYVDGTAAERKIIHYAIERKDIDLTYTDALAVVMYYLNIGDQAKAKQILNDYWIDEEHPLEEDYDYGEEPDMSDYW